MEHTGQLRIRERAYAIWDANGRPDGRADEHWLMAERELRDVETCIAPKATRTVLPSAPSRRVKTRQPSTDKKSRKRGGSLNAG